MKNQLLLICLACAAGSLMFSKAEDRAWTDERTKRVIKGEIVEKKPDGSAVLIRLAEGGKTHWVETKRFIKEDQEFIRAWQAPVEHLTMSHKKDKAGKVTAIVILVVGNEGHCAFMAKPVAKNGASLEFIFHAIDPGETREIELDPGQSYSVTLTGENRKQLAKLDVKAVPQ